MSTLTASDARANLSRLIDEAAESHEPILISGKRSSAVLISAEDWSAIQETLYLLSVPGLRESIEAGMAEPFAESAADIKRVNWGFVYAKQALKDAKKLAAGGLRLKAQGLLALIARDLFQNPPPHEKMVGYLAGAHSRRINFLASHRL